MIIYCYSISMMVRSSEMQDGAINTCCYGVPSGGRKLGWVGW